MAPTPVRPPGRPPNRREARRTFITSLVLNAFCPFLFYHLLSRHFPPASPRPLLWASAFPAIGLALGIRRKGSIDVLAALALLGLTAHVVVTLVVSSITTALVIRSLDGLLVGVAILVSAAVDRPLTLLFVRQIATSGRPDRRAHFDQVIAEEGSRPFVVVSLVWGVALVAMSGVHIWLAVSVPPASYLLLSPLLGLGTVLLLAAWSGHYLKSAGHLRRLFGVDLPHDDRRG